MHKQTLLQAQSLLREQAPLRTCGSQGAQGTIEYLVIIAAVVVISLAVVSLFAGTASSPSTQISSSVGKLGSTSGGGIKITDAIIDSQGNAVVAIQNVSGEGVTITKVSQEEDNVEVIEVSFNEQIVSGEKLFYLTDFNKLCECTSGVSSRTCEFKVTYTTVNNLIKTEKLTINTQCVSSITPKEPEKVVGLGTGTLTNPWIINNCTELQNMNQHLDGNYALGTDINCYSTSTWNSGAGFRPIGNNLGAELESKDSAKPRILFFKRVSFSGPLYSGTKFTGSLDGRGYIIRNLSINRPAQSSQGLFGCLGTGASVTNIGLVDYNIIGYQILGGIVGRNEAGTITKVYTSGTITGLASSAYAGGIVGYQIGANNTISDSYSTGAITGPSSVGGIAGWAHSGAITNTYSSVNVSATSTSAANYAGGIAGFQSSVVVSNSFAVGIISTAGTPDYAGGIAGGSSGVTNCYWNTSLTTQETCYYASSSGCTPTDTPESYYGSSGIPFSTPGLGWSTDIWQANASAYPTLK